MKKKSPTEKNIASSVKLGKPFAKEYDFICPIEHVWPDRQNYSSQFACRG
ncbi:hypothetical protein [Bacteroides ovatus]|nr:hypothetical protein [Bacteroides ovatus]CAG9929789.1 hypothetical protein BOVA208_4043 [Bacteroides ovatus]